MKGMMYNVVYPCLSSLYIHELRMNGIVRPTHICRGGAADVAKRLRAIRELNSVSWPQKEYCDYISQKLSTML